MASLLRGYNALLVRRPMLTQCLTAGFLFGAGDMIAQQVVEKKGKDHDFIRTIRLAGYGGLIFGPPITKWFQFLNRLQFKTPVRGVMWRVYLDQALISPIAVCVFYSSMAVLEGKPHEVVDRLSHAYVPTVVRNWAVFIPTQVINFALVPPHLRFVVVSIVSLFWNTFLSANNAKQARLEEIEEKKEHELEGLTQ